VLRRQDQTVGGVQVGHTRVQFLLQASPRHVRFGQNNVDAEMAFLARSAAAMTSVTETNSITERVYLCKATTNSTT
jgi:hypothetical protein